MHLSIGAIMLFFGGWLLWSGVSNLTDNVSPLITPNGRIQIEIADDAEERYQGLSGRESIDGGLLFVYDEASADHCLVMRDMRFSIDMVWLDENKNVITIQSEVSPDTYPEVFCPNSSARYALELPAGDADRLNIEQGSKLIF